MSKLIGRLRTVGIAKEASKGTPLVPAFWIPSVSFDPAPIVATKQKDGAIGRIEDTYDSEIVSKHNEPSIEGYVTDKAIGLLMLAGFGQSSPSTLETGVYSHAYTVKNDNDHPALTVSFKDSNLGKWITYSMLAELQIDAQVEDYVRFSSKFISRFEATKTGLTPSFYTTDNVFVARHVTVKIADDLAGLSGASAKSLTGVTIKLNKNTEATFGLGSNEPQSIENREFSIEGSLTALEADTTWRDLFTANTSKAMEISIVNSDVTIGAANNPTIKLTMAQVKFNPYKEKAGNGDIISEEISFKGQYSIDDTSSITGTVINTQATY